MLVELGARTAAFLDLAALPWSARAGEHTKVPGLSIHRGRPGFFVVHLTGVVIVNHEAPQVHGWENREDFGIPAEYTRRSSSSPPSNPQLLAAAGDSFGQSRGAPGRKPCDAPPRPGVCFQSGHNFLPSEQPHNQDRGNPDSSPRRDGLRWDQHCSARKAPVQRRWWPSVQQPNRDSGVSSLVTLETPP